MNKKLEVKREYWENGKLKSETHCNKFKRGFMSMDIMTRWFGTFGTLLFLVPMSMAAYTAQWGYFIMILVGLIILWLGFLFNIDKDY